MKKLLTLLIFLWGIFTIVNVNAYCTQDWNYCGGSSWACERYCSGNHYEEPYCPTHCPGYKVDYYNNNYYYTNNPNIYYYTTTPNSYYNNYNNNYPQYSNYSNNWYHCVAYDETDQNYYSNPDYYNYQTYCDCTGRPNCSCGYYQNPNQNNWTPARRCIQWKQW